MRRILGGFRGLGEGDREEEGQRGGEGAGCRRKGTRSPWLAENWE